MYIMYICIYVYIMYICVYIYIYKSKFQIYGTSVQQMLQQDLLFKAQGGVLGGGLGHRVGFQPSGGGLQHCEHIALALVGLWQCDIV